MYPMPDSLDTLSKNLWKRIIVPMSQKVSAGQVCVIEILEKLSDAYRAELCNHETERVK